MNESKPRAWCEGAERLAPPAPPCTLVIFGVTGDLTQRLLMPALLNLARWRLLPDHFALLGIGRQAEDADALRRHLTESVQTLMRDRSGDAALDLAADPCWGDLMRRLDYLDGDLDDPGLYARLGDRLDTARASGIGGNALFYLALPAQFFGPTIRHLAAAGLTKESEGWRRIIVEKPFGHDAASAAALNRSILEVVDEAQVYRIDHFLGKETVQNILAFRFGNAIFEPLWNREHIDHVQITVSETVGVEQRGSFYEATGALRDMVPNHLFQLLTLTAMEPPVSFAADAVRSRKEDVLEAVRPMSPEAALKNSVRGQYAAGTVLGRPVRAYRQEPKVAADSTVETYAALRLDIDNWRWAGVPFYLRTGKAMTRRLTEIAIRFNRAPIALFQQTDIERLPANWLVIQIAPEEGISLKFDAKVPGPTVTLGTVDMRFSYRDYFQAAPSTGYETLIYDCMLGDPTLFQRADNIESGWRVVQPFLDAWKEAGSDGLRFYEAGSAGPAEADDLLVRGRSWRSLT